MKKFMKLTSALLAVMCLMTSLLAVNAFADFTHTYLLGQTIDKTEVYNAPSEILSCEPNSGSLPTGVTLTCEDTRLYISGTVQNAGTYSSTFWVQTEGNWTSFAMTITVASPTPTPGPTIVPTATPAPTATVKPTATPAVTTAPKITKNPTGETVEVGGTAQFVARAENATQIIWRIVSADTTNTVPAKDASGYFSGLKVSGLDTETLTLSNIPKTLNGWSVECKFVGPGGTSFTTGAIIKVTAAGNTGSSSNNTTNNNTNNTTNSGTVKAAAINTQPQGVETEIGKACTLSVSAASPDSGTLSYQWYSSSTNNRANIVSISGATSNTYTPPQTEGTTYYCVAVTNTKSGKQASATYSQLVAVRYSASNGTASPTPSSGLAEITGSAEPTATASPTASVRPSDNAGNRYSFSASLIFFGIIGVLAIAAMVVIIIYIKRSGNGGDDDE